MKGMPKRQFRSILKSLTKSLTCLGNRCSVTISNCSYNFKAIFTRSFRTILVRSSTFRTILKLKYLIYHWDDPADIRPPHCTIGRVVRNRIVRWISLYDRKMKKISYKNPTRKKPFLSLKKRIHDWSTSCSHTWPGQSHGFLCHEILATWPVLTES